MSGGLAWALQVNVTGSPSFTGVWSALIVTWGAYSTKSLILTDLGSDSVSFRWIFFLAFLETLIYLFVVSSMAGVSSVPFPFWFPFQLHCELVSSPLALDETELVSQPLTQMVVEMIKIHVISVQQKR